MIALKGERLFGKRRFAQTNEPSGVTIQEHSTSRAAEQQQQQQQVSDIAADCGREEASPGVTTR